MNHRKPPQRSCIVMDLTFTLQPSANHTFTFYIFFKRTFDKPPKDHTYYWIIPSDSTYSLKEHSINPLKDHAYYWIIPSHSTYSLKEHSINPTKIMHTAGSYLHPIIPSNSTYSLKDHSINPTKIMHTTGLYLQILHIL